MASLVFLLFLLYEASSETEVIRVVQVEPEGPEVPVEPGQDATLQCNASGVNIKAVDWTRSDLVDGKYVLSYSKDGSDTIFQHSSFKGRVQLVDVELKTGDVSLILKNVSRDDVGTYECRVLTAGSRRKKRALSDSDPISRVRLQLTDPGDQNGHTKDGDTKDGDTKNGDTKDGDNEEGHSTPLHVGLVAAVLLVCPVVVVGLFLVRKSKRQRDKTPEPSPAEETGGDNLI